MSKEVRTIISAENNRFFISAYGLPAYALLPHRIYMLQIFYTFNIKVQR